MLLDARTLSPGAALSADVCVIGAGPAGLALALALARRQIKVLLVESGDRKPNAAAQDLAAGDPGSRSYADLRDLRRRQLGGTPHLWKIHALGERQMHARLAPLDDFDFQARPGLPWSGWPIYRADLNPYYDRAAALCGFGPADPPASAG